MKRYKTALRLKKLFSKFPEFRGKYRLLLIANRFLNDKSDHILTDYDDNLLINISLYSHIERCVFWTGYYEKELAQVIKNTVKKDFVCIDIGSNIGVHALLMAKYATDGHVYCFEPFPPVRERLEINLSCNRFTNVTVFPWALGERNEEVKLYIPANNADNYGQSSLVEHSYLSSPMSIVQKKISDLPEIANLSRVDFIKIDVEGFEPSVISSLSPLIESHKPVLVFEYAKSTWRSKLYETLLALEKCDYVFFSIEDGLKRLSNYSDIKYDFCNILCVQKNVAASGI